MPFIGQQPVTGAYHKLDSITTSATATYNLQLNGGAYSPASANHLLVSLNGVIQAPQDSFTVSGSQITFDSALTSSDSIDFIMAFGDVLSVGVPTDGSVNTSQLANSAVTDAKIAGMSSSKLTGALPAIDGSALTGVSAITEIDSWEMRTAFSPSGDGDITANWSRTNDPAYGGLGTGLTESSGIFSFPSTGIYYISFIGYFSHNGNDGFVGVDLEVTTDNSTYSQHGSTAAAGNRTSSDPTMSSSSFGLLDVTDVSNIKFKFAAKSANPCSIASVQFYCIRLGDT